MDTETPLNERAKTHGNFKYNANISQRLKRLFRVGFDVSGTLVSTGFHKMPDAQQEALEMIALKLSRILSGQASFKDHWDDIAGYAKLGSEACIQQTQTFVQGASD